MDHPPKKRLMEEAESILANLHADLSDLVLEPGLKIKPEEIAAFTIAYDAAVKQIEAVIGSQSLEHGITHHFWDSEARADSVKRNIKRCKHLIRLLESTYGPQVV